MRALIVAAAALGASGCCWLDVLVYPPESCVQEATGRCWDLQTDVCVEVDEQGMPLPPYGPACGASRRTGTCEDGGFTVRCGDHLVRPGSSC